MLGCDQCVGRIVSKIDDLGIAENTLVIFFSDNGTHLKVTTQTVSGPVAGGKVALTPDARDKNVWAIVATNGKTPVEEVL